MSDILHKYYVIRKVVAKDFVSQVDPKDATEQQLAEYVAKFISILDIYRDLWMTRPETVTLNTLSSWRSSLLRTSDPNPDVPFVKRVGYAIYSQDISCDKIRKYVKAPSSKQVSDETRQAFTPERTRRDVSTLLLLLKNICKILIDTRVFQQ